jgi:hypothetical protein
MKTRPNRAKEEGMIDERELVSSVGLDHRTDGVCHVQLGVDDAVPAGVLLPPGMSSGEFEYLDAERALKRPGLFGSSNGWRDERWLRRLGHRWHRLAGT